MNAIGLALQCFGPREPRRSPKHSARGAQARVARQSGLSRSHVCNVMSGRFKSHRIAAALSKELGKPAKELWPGVYPALERWQAIEAQGGAKAVIAKVDAKQPATQPTQQAA